MNIFDNVRAIFPKAPLNDISKTFDIFGIDTELERACFFAQVGHESAGFKSTIENLNYSATGLANTFPRRFKDAQTGQPNAKAFSLARHPQEIANEIYNGRLGNRVGTNDGWLFRGRGYLQITGRENYKIIGQVLHKHGLIENPLSIIDNPDMLATSPFASYSAGAFWEINNLNHYCNNFQALTKRINGGLNGYQERLKYLNQILGRA